MRRRPVGLEAQAASPLQGHHDLPIRAAIPLAPGRGVSQYVGLKQLPISLARGQSEFIRTPGALPEQKHAVIRRDLNSDTFGV